MSKKIVITAHVEDGAKWRKEFQTHADLFREQTTTQMHYTVTGANEVAIVSEAKDTDKFLRLLESPETAAAMANDGVKRDTVKVFVLEDELKL